MRSASPTAQTMRHVVLPQAFRNMLPVLLTQTIILFQDTSLVYAIGAKDLLKAAEIAGKNYNRPVEMYLFVALIYFAICLALSRLVKRLQARASPSSAEVLVVAMIDSQLSASGTADPGARRLHHRGRQGRGRRGLRPLGFGQVDADQVRQRPRTVPAGRGAWWTASA